MERLDLVGAPVADAIREHPEWAEEICVTEVDPALSDTVNFCAKYDIPLALSGNCVVVEEKRGEGQRLGACVILATTRADVNGIVRKELDFKRASFAQMEAAVTKTGMEYGGITPIGLPNDWQILVDSVVIDTERIVMGSGLRKSKISVRGAFLKKLPNVKIVENLGRTPQQTTL